MNEYLMDFQYALIHHLMSLLSITFLDASVMSQHDQDKFCSSFHLLKTNYSFNANIKYKTYMHLISLHLYDSLNLQALYYLSTFLTASRIRIHKLTFGGSSSSIPSTVIGPSNTRITSPAVIFSVHLLTYTHHMHLEHFSQILHFEAEKLIVLNNASDKLFLCAIDRNGSRSFSIMFC